MRTYDIEKLANYVYDCFDDTLDEDEKNVLCMPTVSAKFNEAMEPDGFMFDDNDSEWLEITNYYWKSRCDDWCIKSIQRNESSIYTVDQINEMERVFLEHWFKDFNGNKPGLVLLEISYTSSYGERHTHNILTTIDWFDIDGYFSRGETEALQ